MAAVADMDVAPATSLDALAQPLMTAARKPVQVFSPYGKEVVNVDPSCLSGLICGGNSFGNADDADDEWEVMFTIRSSVWFNFFLFLGKVYAYYATNSLAVLASLVDSAVDLLGQGVLLWTKTIVSARQTDGDYPIGRERLEPVGVMVCAVVMGMASMQVISTSGRDIMKNWGQEDMPPLVLTGKVVTLLVVLIITKAGLAVWCWRVNEKYPASEAIKAIGQDNQNDVMSNLVALLAPWATQLGSRMWLSDPVAGILISIYIIYTWIMTGYEQVEMIVGKRADPETLSKIQNIADEHNPSKMRLDQLCAYHFGPRLLVEVEVVMSEFTTLRESHDEGIKLQHKIELLDDVERCFVHIDYQLRECDDHDPNVPIEAKLYGGPAPGSPRTTSGPLLRIDSSESA